MRLDVADRRRYRHRRASRPWPCGRFPAVILGGLDSVQGALAGGLAIGLAEVFAGSYLSTYTDTLGTGYALVVPYVVMLLVLLVRPYGLFGTPEIRRV